MSVGGASLWLQQSATASDLFATRIGFVETNQDAIGAIALARQFSRRIPRLFLFEAGEPKEDRVAGVA